MKRTKRIIAAMIAVLMLLAVIGPVSLMAEAETEYEEVVVDFSVEGEEEDTGIDVTTIGEYFNSQAATGDSKAAVAGEGKVILDKYAHMYANEDATYDLFSGAYAVTLNFTSTSGNDAGIYVRSVDPTQTSVMNTVLGASMSFWFYEWDWYAEHKGASGASGTGGSGVKISFAKNGEIAVTLKTYEPDGLHVLGQTVTLAAPEGFDAKALNPVKITDDGKSHIEIFVCDTLMATVDYSGEPSDYPDDEENGVNEGGLLYYKNAVVKGADGTELLSIDNARIAAEQPVFAIGNRNGTTYFSDLKVSYFKVKKAATPEPTAAPTDVPATEETKTDAPAVTTAPTKAPDGDVTSGT